jgi:hypothetical protein
MIAVYFSQIENVLQTFPNIRTYTLQTRIYNATQGYVSGCIIFENGWRLDFVEVKDTDFIAKLKYRYQCMDDKQALLFRYDNAPHHREIRTFPHHKHDPHQIGESSEPTLYEVLLEVADIERHE